MRKLTLLISMLFLSLGMAWAQTEAPTPVLELSAKQIGTSYPKQLDDVFAEKVYALDDLTIAVRIKTKNVGGRMSLFATSDPTKAANDGAEGTNSRYVGYGMNGSDAGYLASWRSGDRFTGKTHDGITANTDDMVVTYVINPANKTFRVYVKGELERSWVKSHNDGFMSGYEIATPKMVKADHPNAKIYIGGAKNSGGNGEVFNGTITGIQVYDGALTDDEVKAIKFSTPVEPEFVNEASKFKNGTIYTFVTTRGWMGAKADNDKVISTVYAANGVTGDKTNANFQWTVYKSAKNNYYLYNIGKGQFMGVESGNNTAVPFVESPVGVITFKQSSSTDYPIMFSTDNAAVVNHSGNHQYGLISWTGGWNTLDDGGSNHKVESVGVLDAATLASIETLVVEAELQTLIDNATDLLDNLGDGTTVGSVTADSRDAIDRAISQAETAIDNNSGYDAAEAAIQAAIAGINTIQPATDEYYKIVSKHTGYAAGQLLSIDTNVSKLIFNADNNVSNWFKFVDAGEEGKFYLYNVKTGKYLNSNGGHNTGQVSASATTTDAAKAVTITNMGNSNIVKIVPVDGAMIHAQNGGNVVAWNNDSYTGASAWTIVEVENPGVAYIDNTNYATLQAAIEAWTEGKTINLLASTDETIVLPKGMTLDVIKFNGFTADNVSEAPKVAEVATLTELQTALAADNELPIIITAEIEIPAGETVTIDLNGKTVNSVFNGASTTNHIYALRNRGTLTIQDTKGNGSINSRGIYNHGSLTLNTGAINAIDGNGGYAVNNQDGSTFVMNGGVVAATYEDDHQSSSGGYDATALKVPAGCTATLNGGTINNVCDFTFAIDAAGTLNIPAASTITVNGTHGAIAVSGGTTTINAGTFQIPADEYTRTDNVLYVSGGSLVVNGGTFIGDSDTAAGGSCLWDAAGTAVVNGGTFQGSSGGDVLGTTGTTIKGGTFENLIEKQHIAAGYELNADGTVVAKPVAEVNGVKYTSLAEAVADAQSGSEIKLLADVAEGFTVPAGVTFNGNGYAVSGIIVAAGDITFAGVTTAADLDFDAYNTVVNIPAGASLQLNGTARMSIGFGTTFNITGTIENAKTADKATLTPSLVIPGASFSGSAGVKFNVTNAYISVPSSYCSTSKTASGTFDFNITNSIWESAGKLAFEEQSVNAKVDFALVNSVLTTGSHLVFGTASGEEGVVIDNSYVNKDTSRLLENCGTMTVKNGSVVNGAVATSSNAKNPGTVIVENATYAVTGEFSGSDLGTGTLIIKNGATVSAGSITKANITIDATGMAAGDEVLTANLSKLAGTLEVINNDKLEAKIVGGKVVLAAKPVAKIDEQGYATLAEALEAASAMTGDVTVEILDKVTFNQPLIGNYTSINFVGNAEKAEMYLDVQGYITATGKKVSFTDLKLSKSQGGFIANAGFMNVAFGIYDVEEVTYNNCIFENGACASSGKVTFNGCTFKKSWDKYGLWAYGNVDVTVQGSTFADYRGIKMYAENGADASVEKANLTVKNTNFSAVDNKPAIVLTYGESVVLEGNTYSSTGTFELDLDGKPNGVAVTSDVAPVCKNDNGACGVLVDGKIYTTVAQAAEVATETSTVTLLHSSNETVEFPMGTTIEKNGFTADNVTTAQPFAEYIVLPQDITVNNYKAKFGDNTVTDGVNYYATLQAAVEAVAKNAGVTRQANAVLYCKPGADVGSLQHAPVVSTLTVYGNGANVTGGSERDFDLGNTDPSAGKDITADMTLTVKHLNGCGAWGAKATEHTVNLVFENCANMGKVFITGSTGTLNITMKDCAFEGVLKEAVYSNADGAITLNNVAFSNLNKAINLNHKAAGTQTVTIDGCSFTNCGNNVAADEIPVRVLSSVEGGKSVLNVSNATFTGTPTGGADILLDYGVGESALNIAETDANVSVEIKKDVATTTTVSKSDEQQTFTNAAPVAVVNGVEYMTLAQAVAAVEDGGTITLIANETFTNTNRTHNSGNWYDGLYYVGDKSFTIDLGGYTISQKDGAVNDYLLNFKNSGSKANTITLKNGTLDAGTTAFCAICTSSSQANQLTINTEDINIINNINNGSTIKLRGGAVLNVKSGTVITGKDSYLGIECLASTVNIYDGAEIYMNGTSSYNGCLVGVCGNGTVTVYGGYGKGVKGGFIAMTSGGTINVKGGEWIANTDGTVGNNSNLYVLTAQSNKYESGFAGASIINVTGGTFRGGMDAWVLNNLEGEKAELNISGGNFNANPTNYVAEDYIAVENNGVWNVVKAAAKVGEQGYATLNEAFAAATEGQTITLLDDATPALTSQRAITKAAVIDLGGKTMTLTEDDLYFGTTTFKNGTIVVDPSVKPSTAVFWMFANQTLTFDAVKVVATGVTGTYLIGLEGDNSDLNLLNGSEILVENTTALDLDIICVNGTNTCDINVDNSKVNVTNLDGRVFFRGNYTVKDSEVNLAGITKAGFRIEAGQKLSIEGTSKVNITGEPRDGGIHLTDVTAKYTKAADATVNATLNEPAKGSITVAYTSETSIWGEGGGNAKESLVIKVLDANDNVMGTSTLNNVGGIIDGDVYVTWSIMFNAPAPNPEAYWSMEWTTAPSIGNMPAKVAIWVDGVEVGRNNVVLNGPDDLNKIVAAVTDAEGKIISCHTSVANAADVDGVTNIALLRETNEVIELPAGVELNKNNFTAAGVTVKMVAKVGNTEYSSIDKAIEAWTNNTTLTLLDNVTLSDVVTLKSTEHHILDLGTYTMTAASGKNAFEIIATGTGDAERTAITIKADANNPGGINAGSKSIVYYDYSKGTATGNDRPIIKIEGGVFTASTSSWGTAGIYTKGTAARKCATLNISGGTFNCSINGSGKSKLIISGGVFNYSVGSQGDSTALRLISGGTFKTFGFMTADSNNTKFWFGTSMGNSNVGVHVDDNGYIVVGGAVVTEAGDKFEASSTNYSGANSLLQYSSAKDNGLYYTSVEEALADNNTTSGKVTVYADEIDMTGITYKGTIVVPVGETVTITNAPATPAFTVKSADGYVIEPNENGAYESIALVAKIGDKVYDSFEKAVAAAQEGETVTVHKAGTYALKVKNNITITGAVAGVEFANIGAFGCDGANVTFNNVTFTYANNSTYKGLQHSGNLVYNNCTFNGQVFLYGQSETFNECTFNTTDSNNYNVWTYGAKNVAFNKCTFNSAGKSVLIYSEQASNTNNVTVTESQFIATQAVEGKAAIEMDSSLSGAISLTIDAATTAAGFGTGNVSGNSLWNNKKGNNDVANNDITVKVGDTVVLAPIFEAQIGDAQYRFFQDAINAVQNGETITVLRDIATNVEIKEKDNVKVTIDGNGMKMTGTIKVVALSSDNDRRITIKNFKFEDTTSASVDFITSVETNHYPRLTVEGCTFTGSGDATDVALRLKSSKNVEIKNCTGKGLHSFLQNTSGWNLTIEGVTVTESKSAFALGTVQGVTIKGVNVDVQGYGIRMDAGYNNNAVLENNTVKAFIPVVVRKATVNSNVTFNGDENAYTATNEDGIWCAVGTSEYEANGAMPTAATGNVVVALNDAALDSKGIYGNALAGQGTAEAPYLINNIGELVLFRNSVNAGETKYNAEGVYVALAADIDLASVENWSPIGTFDYSFDGNFDGQGHVIKNLKITDNTAANGEAYLGFFGVTANNVIKNFVIENVTIASEGQIVAAAIAYPYYTTVSDITVRGDIAIKGGNYTAGVLAYTRLCQNASNLAVVGNEGSYIKGAQVVGGVIADIQMNKGLVANYSNFSAEGVTVSGTKNVGGISGIIATQTLNGATVKNVTLNSDNAGVGIVAGCLGGTSTISNVTYENVDGATALIGNTYNGTAIEAKIDNTYYATLDAALDAEGEATVELFVPVTVATGESRVIELNGKTVIGTDNATGSFALININPEAELTINGEGAIKLTATNNRGWNAYSSVISNQRGKLTVNGGTIEHLGGTDMAYAIDNLTNTGAQNAETVINGGTVKSTYRAIRQFLNSTSAQNVLTVNGGTIEGANKSIWMQGANAKANPGALTVAAAAAIKGDVYLTSAAGTAEYPVVVAVAADALKDGAQVLTSNVPADFAVANVNGTWTKVAAAASLNGKGYATLRAAVEAAQNGETVELLANVTLAGGYEDATEGLRIEREITLNGNGHTIDCGTFQKGIRIYNLGADGDFQVNFNNVEVVNNVANGRCIDTRSHDINLTIIDSKLIAQNGNSQPLTIGGDKAIQRVKLDDAIIDAGNSGYGVIAFVSVKQNIYAYDDTKVTGYAAFYLKDHGNANIKLSLGKGTYIGKNIHSGASNTFGTVVLEGDNNVLQIIGTNPTLKAITEGNASQAVVLVIGANNKVSLESESATIDIVGENAYYGMISAENAGATTIINKGNTMLPVAEVGGFQFLTIKEAIRYAGNEGTIKIVNDFVLAEAWTIPAGKKYTLDLNGKTVSYTSAVAGEDMITNRGNLTITDSSDAKTGKLAYVNTDNTASNVTVSTISTEPGSTLVVDGGTIENKTVKADGSSIYSFAIDILTNGNLGDVNVTINGGTVYSDYMAIRQFNNGTACKNSLTINGGYIYGAKRAVQVHMDNNAAVTAIKGGKVVAGEGGYAICNFAATSDLAVTGGEFTGAVYSARENFISGGIYDAEVYAGYCAEGYMPNKNTNGTYGVVLVANAYASIDGVTYGSLKAAINAAKAGETITLLQDIKESVTISKNLTIDGAGKTITGMITTDGKSLRVTIKNVNFDGNNGEHFYAVKSADAYLLTIESCTAKNYKYGFLYANSNNYNIAVKNVSVENCANYGAYASSVSGSATFENFTVKGSRYGVLVANKGTRNVNFKNVTFEGAETPIYINENGTGKVTFTFEGVNEMSKPEFYTSQYVNVVAAAQVGTKVCGNLNDAFSAAQTGDTVKMLGDLSLTAEDAVKTTDVKERDVLFVVNGKEITLDMNGKKISVNHQSTTERLWAVIYVEDGASLTVTGNGSIDVDANDNTPKVVYTFLKNGANGELVIENGNFHMDNTEDSMVFSTNSNTVTVKGGTFILDAVASKPNGWPVFFGVNGTNVGYVNVVGGTYNYDIRHANEIKFGEGLTTTNNGDGTWTVVPAVATVGEESFGSIQEAIEAAQTGETVKLIVDVTLTDADVIKNSDGRTVFATVVDKDITLDLNGKTINVDYDATTLVYAVIDVANGASLNVTGNGKIDIPENGISFAYIFLKRGAEGALVIENGEFHMDNSADCIALSTDSNTITVKGGTFTLDAVASKPNGWPVIFGVNGNNTGYVNVVGGTFNYDINHQERPFEVFVPENLAVKANDNGTWTIVPAQAYVTELLGAYVNEPGSREHKVGYATVAEAIAATNNLGKTVTILAGDYTGNLNVNKGVTVKGEIDAEGNNLVTFNGKLSITADGATVENLNFNNSGTAAYVGAKNVTIDGCSLVGSNGLYQSYTSGLVTFKNSYIKGGTYGIHFDGKAGGNIVIENCTVIGWTSFASTIENVTISGTTFAEGNYNQLRLYQNATITDCTFNEKMNIDWGSSNKTAEFDNCSVEGDKELTEIISLANIATKGLEVTIDGVRVSVAAKVDGKYYLSLQAAIDAATVGQTVTIVSDITLTEGVTVAADDNIFIDLNGKTVSMETAEAAVAALIKNNGTLTIESSVDGGKLSFLATAPSAANAYASNTISNYGTFTINGGTVENLSTGGACYALDNYAGSTATINGGKLTAEKTAVRIFNWTNGEANAAELNVVDGEIISNDGYGININAGNAPYVALNISGGTITTNDTDYNLAVYVVNKNSAENFTANISGGTFNGNFALNGVTSTTMAKGKVSVSGGTFDGVICYGEPACQFIAGGSYKAEFTEDYLVYGYQLEANTETALYDANWTGRREVVTINDNGSVVEFANENDITVGTLTYKRNFGTAKNQSFYVPFEVPMSKIKDDFNVYYISNMHAYDNNEDAVADSLVLEAFKLPANAVLKPNYPYIIRAKVANTMMNLEFNEVTLYEAEENSIECSSVFLNFEIQGVYSRRVGPEYEGTYLLSGGTWKTMQADTNLNAFRLGMTITETGDSPYRISPEAMNSIGIRIAGEQNEDGTTTIYDVNAENGEEMIFDLSGRRVLETEKGIYIKDGKKVLVK